ncbi:hypothetical protein FJ364_01820 [Candidatus Dependentiae bacterium]|nr:hypothetical protein [Candidatus Dependentiae bacterium]
MVSLSINFYDRRPEVMKKLLLSASIMWIVFATAQSLPPTYSFRELQGISFQSLGLKTGDAGKIASVEWRPSRNEFLVAVGKSNVLKDLFVYQVGSDAPIISKIADVKTSKGFTIQAAAWSPMGNYIAVAGVTKKGATIIKLFHYNIADPSGKPLRFVRQLKASGKNGTFNGISWQFEEQYLLVSGKGLLFSGMGQAAEMALFSFNKWSGELSYSYSVDENIGAQSSYVMVPQSNLIVQIPPTGMGDTRILNFDTGSLVLDKGLTLAQLPAQTTATVFKALLKDSVVVGAVLGGKALSDGNQLQLYSFDEDFEPHATIAPNNGSAFATDASVGRVDKIATPQNINTAEPLDQGLLAVGGLVNSQQLGLRLFRFLADKKKFISTSATKILAAASGSAVLSSVAQVSHVAVNVDGTFVLALGKNSPNESDISVYQLLEAI